MDNTELLSILDDQINNSIGVWSSELEDRMADALDRYYGRPYGNEQPGRSQVVSRITLETIEWIKPSLLRVFASGQKTVVFDPFGPEDEDQAEQETDYVNHVFHKDNEGFEILYNWFHDALLQKVGYVKVYVDETEKVTTEEYHGLSEFGLADLLDDDELEPIESTEYVEAVVIDTEFGPMEEFEARFDVKVKRTTNERKIVVENLPQEQVLVGRDTGSINLDKATFVAHRKPTTVTELVRLGVDYELALSLPDYDDYERELPQAREENEDEDRTHHSQPDDSMREKEVYECYVYIDTDGDGIAEFRRVIKSGNEILLNEEAEEQSIVALSPIPQPHKHVGLSEADLVEDLEKIYTTLWRQMLDNLYLTNNPEKEVVEGDVNITDLLQSVPGGIKRVKRAGSINPLIVPYTAANSGSMIDMLDTIKESRTGVSRHSMGLDADALAQSTKGAFMGALKQANQRLEMIARVFAETGIKNLFKKIHSLSIKHIDREEYIRLRGEYVEVKPSEWRERNNTTVTVGVGTGNQDELVSKLFALAEKQEQHLMQGSPLVTPKNLHNTYSKLVEAADLKEPSLYFTDPDTLPPPQPQQEPPDPQMMAMQLQAQIEQAKIQDKKEERQHEATLKQAELMAKYQFGSESKQLQGQKDAASTEIIKLHYENIINDLKSRIAAIEIQGNVEDLERAQEGLSLEEEARDKAIKTLTDLQDAQSGSFQDYTNKVGEALEEINKSMKIIAAPKELVKTPDGKKISVPLTGE